MIYASANGQGTPGWLYGCRAFSDKHVDLYNEGLTAAGTYGYGYPPPTQNKTSAIDPAEQDLGNSWHKISTANIIRWKVNDYAGGAGWVEKDTEEVTVVAH